jgi:hypothetical protein
MSTPKKTVGKKYVWSNEKNRHEEEEEKDETTKETTEVPEKPYMPGWPQKLEDTPQEPTPASEYWRVRDGKPYNEYSGDSVLYAKIVDWDGETPVVDGRTQYIPTLGSTLANMTLSGGVWVNFPELETDTYKVEEPA